MAGPRTITIVLVHGAFAESLSNWKPVLGLLLAKGYKVVAAPNPLRGVSVHGYVQPGNVTASFEKARLAVGRRHFQVRAKP